MGKGRTEEGEDCGTYAWCMSLALMRSDSAEVEGEKLEGASVLPSPPLCAGILIIVVILIIIDVGRLQPASIINKHVLSSKDLCGCI